jgi:AAA domain-containing protein
MSEWQATTAKREHVPLLVGLFGPSGGGKTYSALRLAKGIQSVVGGDVYGIDTESRRMLHYADDPDLTRDGWSFKHVPFNAPFGSLRYLEVMRWCVGQGAKTVIVDSMSHEHAGEGGYLDEHDRDLDKFGGNDERKRERNNMRAWIRPATERKKLIRGLLQLDCNFVFTFRAKETVKPDGSGGVTEMGFMPEAGDAFLYEMTVCALLMPNAGGVPTWASRMPGEAQMIKPAKQFTDLFSGDRRPLDEKHGVGLALWARGAAPQTNGEKVTRPTAPAASPPADAQPAAPAETASEPGTANGTPATGGATSIGELVHELHGGQPPDWDHGAWAKGFNEMLRSVKTVADFDALWQDASNQSLRAQLKERDAPLAKSLHAASTSIRKALRSKETAPSQEEEF